MNKWQIHASADARQGIENRKVYPVPQLNQIKPNHRLTSNIHAQSKIRWRILLTFFAHMKAALSWRQFQSHWEFRTGVRLVLLWVISVSTGASAFTWANPHRGSVQTAACLRILNETLLNLENNEKAKEWSKTQQTSVKSSHYTHFQTFTFYLRLLWSSLTWLVISKPL